MNQNGPTSSAYNYDDIKSLDSSGFDFKHQEPKGYNAFNIQDIEYATLNRRVLAAAIDILFLTIIMSPLIWIFNLILFDGKSAYLVFAEFMEAHNNSVTSEELWDLFQQTRLIEKYLFIQLSMALFSASYFILFWRWFSRTPGKMMTRCRIIDLATGQNISIKQSIIRFLGYIVSCIPACIGFVIIPITKYKQGFHDMIAKTAVIVTKRSDFNS